MLKLKPNTWIKIQKLTPEGPIIVPRLVLQHYADGSIAINDTLDPFEERPYVIEESRVLQVMPRGWMPGL